MNSARLVMRTMELVSRPQVRRGALLMLLTLAAALLTVVCRRPNTGPVEQIPKPLTAKVAKGRIRLSVRSTGVVVAGGEVELKSKASGQVLTVECELGSEVKAGDLLVTIDPASANRAVQRCDALLKLEQVKVAQAQQIFDRLQETLKQQLPSAQERATLAETRVGETETQFIAKQELFNTQQLAKAELDAAERLFQEARQAATAARERLAALKEQEYQAVLARLDLDLAKARVAEVQLDLTEAKALEADTKIHSPVTGVVTAMRVAPGQLVSSGLTNVGGGAPLMTISDFSTINVEASIAESDIGHLSNNFSARIETAVFPAHQFKGRVMRIAPQGVKEGELVTFCVWIEIEDEEKSMLRPGMTAAVEIAAPEKSDVLLVPAEAVLDPTRSPRVFVLDAIGTFRERAITIGLTDGVAYEVLTGLEIGEEVLLNHSEIINNSP
jgi:RND family efflux transporter MFP subunit